MENMDRVHFEELLNQKPKCFENWLQHIKTELLSGIYELACKKIRSK